MNKLELLEILEYLDDEEEIFVATQTHNYWRMIAVKPILSLDLEIVEYSTYLNSLEIVDEENKDRGDHDQKLKWVIRIEE